MGQGASEIDGLSTKEAELVQQWEREKSGLGDTNQVLGQLNEAERRLVLARAILGEWPSIVLGAGILLVVSGTGWAADPAANGGFLVTYQAAHDIGLAFDGDGDRLIVCDEKGQIVDGDHIMAICAKDLLKQRKLRKKTLVATVMSNMGLEAAMESMGGSLTRTAVGDRYVVESMRKNKFSFGGEQSGHLVFLDHITTGDGALAGLQLLSVMRKQDRPLSARAFAATSILFFFGEYLTAFSSKLTRA